MKAKLSVKEDVMIVNLSGRINLEYTEPFREACEKDIANRADKIIFDLGDLSFVGSNGIMPFVSAISSLAVTHKKQLRFCQVSSEFKKIFAASPLAQVQIYDHIDQAVDSLKNLDFLES